MRCVYAIGFRSPAGYYARLIEQLSAGSPVEVKVQQITPVRTTPGMIRLFIEGDEEAVQLYLDGLGQRLPLSIHMGEAQVVEVDWPESFTEIPPFDLTRLSLLPEVLPQLLDSASAAYYNPALHHETTAIDYPQGILKEGGALLREVKEAQGFQELFATAARLIDEGRFVRIHTIHGSYTYGKELVGDFSMVADLEALKPYAMSEKEFQLLHACERPVITLFGENSRIEARLPSEAAGVLLAHELKKRGILSVGVALEEQAVLEIKIGHAPAPAAQPPRLLPLPDRNLQIKGGEAFCEPPDSPAESCEPACGALLSVMLEKQLESETLAGLYLPLDGEAAGLYGYKRGYGLKPAIRFVDGSPGHIYFEALYHLDDSRARLMQQFHEKSPDALEKIQNRFAAIDSLWQLFGLFGACIGIESETIEDSYRNLLITKNRYQSEGSVKIDMKLDGNSGYFNPIPTIATILSFRLAGVEKELLAYGLFESFADFLNDNLHALLRKVNAKDAVMAGSMFGDKDLTRRLLKHSTHLYSLHHNEALPIDGANRVLGCQHADCR